MSGAEETREQLLQRIQHLEMCLDEAESTLQAIHRGEVDAVVVASPSGPQVYTLYSADQPYRLLVQEMQEGALTLSPTGLILYANLAFARMMRMPLEHIVGVTVQRFVAPRDLQRFMALFERGVRGNGRGEVTLQAQDGTLVPAFIACNSLRVDDFQSVCLVVTDLTEQKRQEEILVSEALARAILDQAAEALIVIDNTGYIIRASQEAHRLAGCNVLLQDFDMAFPLQCEAAATSGPTNVVSAALRGEILHGLDATLIRPDGRIFQLMLSIGPLLNSRSEIAGGIITLADITARKQAEQELRQARAELELRVEERTAALRREMAERERLEEETRRAQHFALLGRLAAGVSHELRNPLGALFLHVDLLEEELRQPTPESSGEVEQIFLDIRTQMVRLDELLQDYLSLVRVSTLQLQSQDLGLAVQTWCGEMQAKMATQKISFQSEGLESLGHVRFHASTLRRVVINLLQNALDAMPEGGTLHLLGRSTVTQSQLVIQDTGSGIPAAQLEHIFEPLFTTKPGGTGLGLYIVQEVVRAHGGQIAVQSSDGQGTMFTLTLPQAASEVQTLEKPAWLTDSRV